MHFAWCGRLVLEGDWIIASLTQIGLASLIDGWYDSVPW